MKRKLGAVLVILALVLSVLSMTAVSANTVGPSWIWGTDPASTDEELVLLDAWTGFEYARFALPGDPSGDTELALAGESAQLYYVNGDDDDATVYLLDPSDGSTLGTVTLTGGWNVDGIGNYGGGGGYLYTSGCPVLDMHRYPAAGGSPTFFWSTIFDPLAVGGDDTGRIYSTDYVAEQYVIAEVDPVNNVAPLNTFASPTQDIVGMAFDGTYLYVSDTNNMLYILDPDDGTVENSLDLGYSLYALAVTEVLPVLEVDIDIKPGSDPNSINVDKKNGVTPVAILTTATFDVATVDPVTVLFGPDEAAPLRWAFEDVDEDGDIDMILHFKTQETGIEAGADEACLIGLTKDGIYILGCDSVRTVPPEP